MNLRLNFASVYCLCPRHCSATKTLSSLIRVSVFGTRGTYSLGILLPSSELVCDGTLLLSCCLLLLLGSFCLECVIVHLVNLLQHVLSLVQFLLVLLLLELLDPTRDFPACLEPPLLGVKLHTWGNCLVSKHQGSYLLLVVTRHIPNECVLIERA